MATNQATISVIYTILFGQAWKTQELTDKIMSDLYFNDPNGLSGNEDCGQMSAWYVLNAMGFYSFCPGNPVYSIGRPLFDEVKIKLANGRTCTIVAKNNSPENKYIKSAKINGETLNTTFFSHDDLMTGAKIELIMADKPNINLFN